MTREAAATTSHPPAGGTLWRLACVAVIAGFVINAFAALLRDTQFSGREDTWSYLAHSVYLAEHGGVWGFLREAFAGTFPIVERHPLYMLLLSPMAERTAWFFFQAKLANLVLGMLVLASFCWMVWRRDGAATALLAGTGYAASASLIASSSHVCSEPALILTVLWTWWWLTGPQTAWRWGIAGLWLGLAFLAKSPAILVMAATLAARLWHTRGRALASPALWLFILAAVLVASPLLVRNVRAHGQLLWEGINSSIMWQERRSDVGNSDVREDTYGVLTIERDTFPTLAQYLRTHRLGDVALRLGRGAAKETRIIIRALATDRKLPGPLALAWGLGVLLAALAGWWLQRRTWVATLCAWWVAAFLAFFSWDAEMWPAARYVAPLIPVVFWFAGRALWQGVRRLASPARAAQIVWGVCLLLTAVLTVRAMGKGVFDARQPVLTVSPAFQRLVAWMNAQAPDGARVVSGPTREFDGYLFFVAHPMARIIAPHAPDEAAYLSALRDRRISHLVVHRENIRGWDGELASTFAAHWSVTPEGGMMERTPVPGWEQAYADSGVPARFLVYRPARDMQTSAPDKKVAHGR